MKNTFLLLVFLVFVSGITPVQGQNQDNEQKAQAILKEAREIVSKKTKDAETKIFVGFDSQIQHSERRIKQGKVPRYSLSREWLYANSNKFEVKNHYRYESKSENLGIQSLDGAAYNAKSSYKDANAVGFKESENRDSEEVRLRFMRELRYDAFSVFFPLLLDFDKEMKFSYLGVAKSGEQTADVIGTKLDGIYDIQLFFDKKTHKLILMVSKFFRERWKENIEHKFFFSDYETEDGFNFAHKIVIQENGEVMEERKIQKFIANSKQEFGSFEFLK
jgi:hypothetical protein